MTSRLLGGGRRALQRSARGLARGPLLKLRIAQKHRLEPVSRVFGLDRGTSIARRYIDAFVGELAGDVRGIVLEIGDPRYTQRFGGDKVDRSDVLRLDRDPTATIVADLVTAHHLPSCTYDCILCTQTLQFIYDVPAAVSTLHRMLKPGGVLVVTASGISQISRYDKARWGEYWRFTSLSLQRLLGDTFGQSNVDTRAYGNVLAATALLEGLAAEELRAEELEVHDPDYEVVLGARARRSASSDDGQAVSIGNDADAVVPFIELSE